MIKINMKYIPSFLRRSVIRLIEGKEIVIISAKDKKGSNAYAGYCGVVEVLAGGDAICVNSFTSSLIIPFPEKISFYLI